MAKRHLRLVKDQIKPEEVSLDTSSFDAIPDEDELDLLLDEVSDAEFGEVDVKDAKPVKLKEWKAEEFASIYVRFRPHLGRHARKWLTNQSQVDEVVQDAFLYLMVSLPELDSEIGVLKFMKWKVKNLCLDIYRASGRAHIKSINDVAEPIALDAELGSDLERAEDAAIVRLALSKLNPRHREVLLASIYEEKTTAEIAAQVGLSENATLQLLFRARGAFKKALLGDVDTNGMSMGAILSVAARKAADEAKKVGVQAMVLVLFLALSIGALINFNGQGKTSVVPIAEAPNSSNNEDIANNELETSTPENALKVSTVARTFREVPEAIDNYTENELSSVTVSSIVASNQNANISVFRASKTSTTQYVLEAAQGVTATFTYNPDNVSPLSDLMFTINADGIDYFASAQNVRIQVEGARVFVVGNLSYLFDRNEQVFDKNGLSKAAFQLSFEAPGAYSDGKLSIYSAN